MIMKISPMALKVMDFMSKNPYDAYSCAQVAEKLGLSIPTTSQLLRELVTMERIRRKRDGRNHITYVLASEPAAASTPTTLPAFKPLEGYADNMRRIAASAIAGR
jgi:DNA-binding IclR family transcriptional regulator